MNSIKIEDIPCLRGLDIKWGIATVSSGTPEEQRADLLKICEVAAADNRRLDKLARYTLPSESERPYNGR